MQTHLPVGPTPIKDCRQFSSGDLLPPSFSLVGRDAYYHRRRYRDGRSRCQRSRRKTTVISAASYSSSWASASNRGEQKNHYVVLGIARNATQDDVKRAYRLLARKFHPDVNKDSKAGELFKSIRCSYEVLSNEATRTRYDQELKLQESSRFPRVKRNYYNTPDREVEDAMKYCYNWSEKRRGSSRYERVYGGHYSTYPNSHSYNESQEEKEEEEETAQEERDSFPKVVKSVFLSMFLLYTLGYLASLTFSTFSALLDKELDTGYKAGFMIAWILGGKGGILLTLCLTFGSWLCGKASSSVVVLGVVAMWVGSNLARHAPLPQGALLTLLYMSIKLQVDSR